MTNTIKRKNNIIKYMMFAVLFLFTFTLTACDNEEGFDYSDFEEFHLESWKVGLEQSEDQYLLYYYGVNCSHCKTVKQDILGFADSNQADLAVYFIESGQVPWEDYQAHKITNPQTGEDIPGTPTVIVVKDGEAKAFLVGPSVIKDLLSQINEGTYGFID